MTQKIELRPSDLIIGEYTDKNTGEAREIVRLSSHICFDEGFIQEMKDNGVNKFINRKKDEEENEEEEEEE